MSVVSDSESMGTGGGGSAAPLDLTMGHLSTSALFTGNCDDIRNNFAFDDSVPFVARYQPLRRATTGQVLPNWYVRVDADYQPMPLVAKIQKFRAGGYEVSLFPLDMEKIGRSMDCVRVLGKRLKPEQQNENDVIRSQQRAKRQVRLKIKSMGCDRLLTLTKRESSPVLFWTSDDWAVAWKKFIRLCAKAGISLEYVAVLETHEKGNYHLHAAICGKANIKIIRQFWWVCCGGRGQGNVDISFKQGISDYKRRAGVARYVSKYITKQNSNVAFNKKRYWSSRHELIAPIRYVLPIAGGAGSAEAGLIELAELLGLSECELLYSRRVYKFYNFSGAWFSYDDDLAKPPPF